MSCNITVSVAGEGVILSCALGRSVGWSEAKIRERFNITGGSIDCNDVAADVNDIIEAGKKYAFIGGRIAGQGEFDVERVSRLQLMDRTAYDDDINKLLDLVVKANLPTPKPSIIEKYREGRRVRDSDAYALTVDNPSTVASKGCFDMSNFDISSLNGDYKPFVSVVKLNNNKLRVFLANRIFDGSMNELVRTLADLTPVLNRFRSLFIYLREKRFGYTEAGFFQPLYTLFLENVASRIGRPTDNKPGSSFPLSMDADVLTDRGSIENVTISGKTDIVKVSSLDDDSFDNIQFVLELKPPFASLYDATSDGPKGQLVCQLLGVWEMSSQDRAVSIGGLTDIFALVVCVSYADSKKEFLMTKSVVDAEEYLLHLILLFCYDHDIRDLVEAEGGTAVPFVPHSHSTDDQSPSEERKPDPDCGGGKQRSQRSTGTASALGRRTTNSTAPALGSAKSKRLFSAEVYDICFEGECDLQSWYARHNGYLSLNKENIGKNQQQPRCYKNV